MSYRITLAPNRRAATRFIGTVRRRLQRALADNPEVSRSDIARQIDVHRSVITRQLNGTADMSLGRVAEIAWALGYRPKFDLEQVELGDGRNVRIEDIFPSAGQTTMKVVSGTSSTVVSKSSNQSELELA